ncbi:MAG: hypothetical protein Q9225_002351 [Loekoesia sp. 1 TL-2023]
MFASRLRGSLHALQLCAPRFGPTQRRGARVVDSRFLVTHHQTDRVTEKYRDKLQRKARREGLGSVDELKAVYRARIQEETSKAATPALSSEQSIPPFPPPPVAPNPTNPRGASSSSLDSKSSTPPGLKTLSSYLDLDKTAALPPKEIEYVWRLRHASSPTSLCAILPSAIFSCLRQSARKHPQFILPLPQEGSAGAEIHFLQWSFPTPDNVTVIFTHLAEYKLRGEFSQPHTTITMHSELMKEKGLVLMQGQVVEGRGVSVEEARWLVLCLQKFYGEDENGDGGRRRRLLEMFTQGNEAFRVEQLVEEAEKVV